MLELGYGAGQALFAMGKRGYEIYGLDIGEGLCDVANERCRKEIKEGMFHIEVGNIESNYKYDDNAFDVVVVIGALQYLYNPNSCFKEVHRVLKASGHFIIAQRNIYSLGNIVYSFRDFCRTCIHFFLREKYELFSSFKSMLTDSRLGIIFKPFENSWFLNTKLMLERHDIWKYKIKKRFNSYYSLRRDLRKNGFICKKMAGAYFNYSENPENVRKNLKVSRAIEKMANKTGITFLHTLGRSVVLLGQKK